MDRRGADEAGEETEPSHQGLLLCVVTELKLRASGSY